MNVLKRLFFIILTCCSIVNNAQQFRTDEVRNLAINSQYAEIGVKFMQNDKVIFASSKKNKTDKKRDRRNNRHLGLRLYSGSMFEDGTIANVKTFRNGEYNPIHEANITFTSDFKTVYFTRNNYINDDYRKLFKKDTFNTHILKIYKANINEMGQLSNVISLPINSSIHSVTNPQLSPDDKKLFFVSDMESSFGGFDIYEINIHADGTYGKPKNLGNAINSSEDELFPFVDSKNTLYFASNGHGGLGYLDVFSTSLDNDTYKNPINLGAPVNSDGDDFAFVYNNSRNIGYVSSTRRGSVGDADIYTFNTIPFVDETVEVISEKESKEEFVAVVSRTEFELPKEKITDTILKINEPVKIITDSITSPVIAVTVVEDNINPCVQIIEGSVLNAKNIRLNNATVTLYENGNNIGTYKLSPDGKYHFEVKCNNHYRVTARLNKFEESYYELRTTRFSGSITNTNITLKKNPCDVLLTGVLKDINTTKMLKGVKIYLLENGSQINATQTNANGKYSFTVECNGDYKIATDYYGYKERIFDVDKSAIHNTTIILKNLLTPLACSQIVNGKITDLNSGAEVENAIVEILTLKNKLIETATSNANGNFHFNISCDENYKIKVSHENYVTAISEFKSTSIDSQIQRLDFVLTPNTCQQSIVGTIANAHTKTPMDNVNVSLLKNNKVIASIKSSSSGEFKFDVDCNSNYKISATIKNFSIQSKTIVTDDLNGGSTDISIILETRLDFELVRDQLMILTSDIDFDLNQSNIRDDAASELNKVVTIMKRNAEIKVDIGVHTDSRAPDEYNLNLSEQRAQSIITYLISKGVNINRLSGKGYGETQLLNECENGVRCTETQHSVNRRIEFLVTK